MGTSVNIVVAGLGGQGVLTCSDIIAQAAFIAGRDVKKAEVHGMSQRGGSVTSGVRIGDHVLSPMVPAGEADYLLLLEPGEADAVAHRLKPGGQRLSAEAIDPNALPTRKALNVAMAGMLSACLEIPETAWLAAVRACLPERLYEANEKAFQLGRAAMNREETPDV
ncbi:MAG: 2-oxoacid:acceptor oxidoreductase family protein [Kiritimatiellae bacterium]|nr:2-oxoacid:acceptor oxidoreductase family protein [Kiritimatiellia bacterium]